MEDVVLLEWTFTPADYFEDEIRIVRSDYEMVINNGKVVARINPEAYGRDHQMRDSLHDALNDRFLGVQLVTHKPFDLSKASMCRILPDGRKDVTIFPESCVMTMRVGTVDIVQTDIDGNVVNDTRRERIEKKNEFAELVEKFRSKDTVCDSLVSSYKSAVNDPDNELVHLYEIRDALSKSFSGEANARQALGISSSDWSRLGQLANSEPLKQGRHRGKSAGELRDATSDELTEARRIARSFVEAYLRYLCAS